MTPESKLPALTVINGAQKLLVQKIDGTSEDVSVAIVPVSRAGDYIESAGNLSRFVELACNKPAGWADTLSHDSLFEVDAVFRRISDGFIDRYLKRQTEAVGSLMSLAKKHGASTPSLLTQ